MAADPLFSVVVPAYNEWPNLPGCLAALRVAEEYFHKNSSGAIEVIVVDNASTDGTARAAESLGARVVREEIRQIARARNRGAAAARGEILVFCDADSRLHPETFTRIAGAMADPKFLGGGIRIVPDEPGFRAGLWVWDAISWALRISGGTLCCRKDAFERAGGFPEQFYIGEEVAFQFRLKRLARAGGGRTGLVPGLTVRTSMRKVRQFGWRRYSWAVLRCVFCPWLAKRREYCGLWYDVRHDPRSAGEFDRMEIGKDEGIPR